ncbi:MAG: Trp family transcriptional regulator [Candidatus Brennerbacteria bacterium]
MVRVNKNRLKGELKKEAWKRFSRLVGNAHTDDVLLAALRAVLTPAEIIALEKRLAIAILLEHGESYQAIGHTLDVTSVTISAVKRGIGTPPKHFRP